MDASSPDWNPVVGPYRLVRRLGSGRLGVVYLGHHQATGAPAAVKLIHPEQVGDAGPRARRAREVAAAQRVPRWCTAAVIAADLSADPAWVATEYIDGPSLDTVLLERGRLAGAGLTALATGVAAALRAMHDHGVAHQDLKPSDVLFSPAGPRVVDFGISGPDPVYPPPEHAAGTPAADVYAWACLVTHAATGRPPSGTPGVPPAAGPALPGIDALPEPLRGLVAAASAPDPHRRPSAAELVDRLARTAPEAALPVLATAATAPAGSTSAPASPPAAAPVRRTRWRRLAIAGVAIAATIAAAAAMTTAAVRSFVSDTPPAAERGGESLAFGTELAAPLAAHARVDAVAVGELAGAPVVATAGDRVVRVWDLATGEQVGEDLAGHTGDIESVAVGELAGATVVVAGASVLDGGIRQWDLGTGEPLETVALNPIGPGGVGTLDGDLIAIVDTGPFASPLRVVDLDSGRQIGEQLTGYNELGFPQIVAVGRADDTMVAAAAILLAGRMEVEIWDLTTGRSHATLEDVHVTALAVGQRDGEAIVIVGESDGSARVWSATTGQLVDQFTHDGVEKYGFDGITALATGELDGTPIVVSGGENTVQVRDLSTGDPIGEPLDTAGGTVTSLALGEVDGAAAVVAGTSVGVVHAWSIA